MIFLPKPMAPKSILACSINNKPPTAMLSDRLLSRIFSSLLRSHLCLTARANNNDWVSQPVTINICEFGRSRNTHIIWTGAHQMFRCSAPCVPIRPHCYNKISIAVNIACSGQAVNAKIVGAKALCITRR